MPIESDQCGPVKAHPLLAFSLFGGEELEGESLPLRAPPAAVDAECWAGAFRSPSVCRHVAERASKGDLGDQLQFRCHHDE